MHYIKHYSLVIVILVDLCQLFVTVRLADSAQNEALHHPHRRNDQQPVTGSPQFDVLGEFLIRQHVPGQVLRQVRFGFYQPNGSSGQFTYPAPKLYEVLVHAGNVHAVANEGVHRGPLISPSATIPADVAFLDDRPPRWKRVRFVIDTRERLATLDDPFVRDGLQ